MPSVEYVCCYNLVRCTKLWYCFFFFTQINAGCNYLVTLVIKFICYISNIYNQQYCYNGISITFTKVPQFHITCPYLDFYYQLTLYMHIMQPIILYFFGQCCKTFRHATHSIYLEIQMWCNINDLSK